VRRIPTEHAVAVLIADAHRLVRAGYRLMLEEQGDIVVVGEAASGEEAVAGARRLRPDVVLLEEGLPGFDALRATRAIFESGLGQVRVLLLAESVDDEQLFAAVRAGAHGVLRRDGEPADLRRAVRVVARGGALLAPDALRRLAADVVARRASGGSAPPELDALTEREREVLALVGQGFSNAEIADRLTVSPATVKAHVRSALAKLDARDRAELVMVAYESGLVVPPAGTTARDGVD
jgi:DNA-binding NarL/FixJ family response regulator